MCTMYCVCTIAGSCGGGIYKVQASVDVNVLSVSHTYHTIMHNAPKSWHVPNASYSEQIQYDACAYTTTGHAHNAIVNVTNITLYMLVLL